MAVVLKINPGFDASYPWREIGTDARPEPVSGLDYYLAPADKGGEPAGRWAGRGLATLGFTAGQVIDRGVFEPLYGEHLDPRDPAGKTRLGRAAQRFTPEQVIFEDQAAAEPHASPARLAELRTLAKAQARHAVPFWDVTVSVSKSITLFYGGLLAEAEQARRSGDAARADHLEHQAGRVWAAIMEGNRAALEYLQDEAGMTRTGYHRGSGTESGAELGKREHARNWVIGSFRQHTSRDGDPQLHVHNLVLNKVETERDGKWRKLDSRSLFRFQGAAAAIAAAVTESALTREFGVTWVPRADGHGREIAGISQELMDEFSSRRQTITEDARAVAPNGRRRPGAGPTRGRCTGSRRTSPTAPERASRRTRWISGPSCASGSRRRGTGTWASYPPSRTRSRRRRGRPATATSSRRGKMPQPGRCCAWRGLSRGSSRVSMVVRRTRSSSGRSSGLLASSRSTAPIPGQWIRRCSCRGGKHRSAPTRRRSARSGARSPGHRPAPARHPARYQSRRGRWRSRRRRTG
jgi:TrwC relaxase